MEGPWNVPKPGIRASEKIEEQSNIREEVREDLAANDGGTAYIRERTVHITSSRKIEIEAKST